MSNLIEKMADDWWEKLCEREGDTTTFVEDLARLLRMKSETPEDRKEIRRVVLDRVLDLRKWGEKSPHTKPHAPHPVERETLNP